MAAADTLLYKFWGHQHSLGDRVTAELVPPGGSASMIYDVTWGAPVPVKIVRWEDPIAIAKGTTIRTTCTWTNPLGEEVRFPDEMCAFGGIVASPGLQCIGASYRPSQPQR